MIFLPRLHFIYICHRGLSNSLRIISRSSSSSQHNFHHRQSHRPRSAFSLRRHEWPIVGGRLSRHRTGVRRKRVNWRHLRQFPRLARINGGILQRGLRRLQGFRRLHDRTCVAATKESRQAHLKKLRSLPLASPGYQLLRSRGRPEHDGARHKEGEGSSSILSLLSPSLYPQYSI